jgi:hypothetical protein
MSHKSGVLAQTHLIGSPGVGPVFYRLGSGTGAPELGSAHLALCSLDFLDRVNDALPLRDFVEHL